jgi:hypothetical protein
MTAPLIRRSLRIGRFWGIFIAAGLTASLALAPPATALLPARAELEVSANEVVPGQDFIIRLSMRGGAGQDLEAFFLAHPPGADHVFIFHQNGEIDCIPAVPFAVDVPTSWPAEIVPPKLAFTLQCGYSGGFPHPHFPLPDGTYDLYAGLVTKSYLQTGFLNIIALDGPIRIVVTPGAGVAQDHPSVTSSRRVFQLPE